MGHGTCFEPGLPGVGIRSQSGDHHLLRGMRPMRTLIASLAFAMLVLTLPAAAQEPAGTKAQAVLTPGDSVRIEVWRKPEFSGDFVVAPDGTITHPLFRSVRVGGLPFATAEANLRTFLGQFEENPQFVMEPLIRVAVSGEVTRPIVYAARPETSIGEAVARAGGTTQFAARSRVRVIRIEPNGAQQQILINLADPSSTEGTLPVRSGDQIVVDRRKSFFRDIMVPALGIIGSIASLGLLIDRVSRQN
jgi:protein involved in polysaccharide export with SLBB domain